MKKLIVILCVLVLAGALAVGAIVVYAMSDDIGNAIDGDGTTRRKGLDKEVTVTFSSGEDLCVEYDKSKIIYDGFADIYKDENGNDYIFKNGKLAGYCLNETDQSAADCTPIGEDAAVKAALECLRDYTDSADGYELRSCYEKENDGQYFITLSRRIGEVFTDEDAEIWVMYDGAVKSVDIDNPGEYADISESTVERITEETLREFAQSEMEMIYPDEEFEFEIDEYYITKNDVGYYIAIYGKVMERTEVVRYELEV